MTEGLDSKISKKKTMKGGFGKLPLLNFTAIIKKKPHDHKNASNREIKPIRL